jgi:hypothetical protein
MNVNRVATAGSIAIPTAQMGASAAQANKDGRHKRVEPAAIVSIRSRYTQGYEAARSGHAVQEAANQDVVSTNGLDRVRSLLKRGFESMTGGHKVQQLTYERTVSTPELTHNIETIERNVMGMAGGSEVQHQVKRPELSDKFVHQAKQLAAEVAEKLQQNTPKLEKIQARGIDRNAATRMLG